VPTRRHPSARPRRSANPQKTPQKCCKQKVEGRPGGLPCAARGGGLGRSERVSGRSGTFAVDAARSETPIRRDSRRRVAGPRVPFRLREGGRGESEFVRPSGASDGGSGLAVPTRSRGPGQPTALRASAFFLSEGGWLPERRVPPDLSGDGRRVLLMTCSKLATSKVTRPNTSGQARWDLAKHEAEIAVVTGAPCRAAAALPMRTASSLARPERLGEPVDETLAVHTRSLPARRAADGRDGLPRAKGTAWRARSSAPRQRGSA
jgi:hypothetical protein